MAESPAPLRVASEIGGAAGLVGLIVTAILYYASLPWPIILLVGGMSFGALAVGILGHVFFSNSVAVETIGDWRQGYVATTNKQRIDPASLPTPKRIDSSLSLEEIEQHYELKKLKPNFVDKGHEYVSAYHDSNGVV